MRSRFKGILQTSLKLCLLGFFIITPHHLSPADSTRKTIVLNMSFDNPECTIVHKILREGGIPKKVYKALSAHRDLIATPNSDGNTPLHYAVWYGADPRIINTLIYHGADRNGQNNFGWTPLSFVIKKSTLKDQGAIALNICEYLIYVCLVNVDCMKYTEFNLELPTQKVHPVIITYLDFALKIGASSDIIQLLKNHYNKARTVTYHPKAIHKIATYTDAPAPESDAPAGAGDGGEGAAAHTSAKAAADPAFARDEE